MEIVKLLFVFNRYIKLFTFGIALLNISSNVNSQCSSIDLKSHFNFISDSSIYNYPELSKRALDSVLKLIYHCGHDLAFSCDSTLFNQYSDNYNNLIELNSLNTSNSSYNLRYSLSSVFAATIYIQSYKYCNLIDSTILDSVFSNKDYILLNSIQKRIDKSVLSRFFERISSCDDKMEYFKSISMVDSSSQIVLPYIINNIEQIRNCEGLYYFVLRYLKYNPSIVNDSILALEEENFLIVNDTSTTFKKVIRDKIFKNLKDSLDILLELQHSKEDNERGIEMDEIDNKFRSIRDSVYNEINGLDFTNQKQKKIILDYLNDTIFYDKFPYFNWINYDSLIQEEKRIFNIAEDTTLYSNSGFPVIYSGEDGQRFDIFTNEELVTLLSKYNLIDLQPQYLTEFKLNCSSDIIHLRKILQLIGDRIQSGSMNYGETTKDVIDQFISMCESVLENDTLECWQREVTNYLLQIWTPITSKLLEWTDNGTEKLFNFSVNYFHYLINSESLQSLINMALQAEKNQDFIKMERYFAVLQKIYYLENLDENALSVLPPRRKTRTFNQSKDWNENLIYPLLSKYNYLH